MLNIGQILQLIGGVLGVIVGVLAVIKWFLGDKPPKRKLIRIIVVIALLIGGLLLIVSTLICQKSPNKMKDVVDSTHVTTKEASPRVDTVRDTLILETQGAENPKDTVEKPVHVFDSTCAIIFLKGDTKAESDARKTRDFLASKTQGNLTNYLLIDKEAKWFVDNKLYIQGGTDIQLFYNYDDSLHRDLADRIYYRISEGISGNTYKYNKLTGLIEIDTSLRGHGVLRNCQFNSVAQERQASNKADLQDYAVSVIIAPYSLEIDTSSYLEDP